MVFEHFLTFLTKNNNFHFFSKKAFFTQGTSLKPQPPNATHTHHILQKSESEKAQNAPKQFKTMFFRSFLMFLTKNKNFQFFVKNRFFINFSKAPPFELWISPLFFPLQNLKNRQSDFSKSQNNFFRS